VTTDGVRTTPLSGQPDLLGGLTPEVEAMVQANIESGYRRFLALVGRSRGRTAEQVDAIAQGRVWDGGTARQLGLVDQFGGLEDALAYAARAAKLGEGEWHPEYLGVERNSFESLLVQLLRDDEDDDAGATGLAALAGARQAALGTRLAHDATMLMRGSGLQAYCLECPVVGPASTTSRPLGLAALLARLAGLNPLP
jgi:protease IV